MSFAILGLGTAVPDGVITQDESVVAARAMSGRPVSDAAWLPGVYAQSGIDTRHQVHGRGLVNDLHAGTRESGSPFLPGEVHGRGPTTGTRMALYAAAAGPLASKAAGAALAESGLPAKAVTHLVTVSCTGFTAPGVDVDIIRTLGLPPTVLRTHVGYMGCHGAVNGLRVADAFCRADADAVVMLAAVELCSLHYYYGAEPDKVVANALFADGAAAVVGRAGGSAWRVASTGSCLIPETTAAMGWTVGDHGFEMTLSRTIPRVIAKNLGGWMADWLAKSGLTIDAVGSWAVHPGGPRILDGVEEGLKLPADALAMSRQVLAAFGNMSSPTVLFIIDRLRRENAARPCVVLGFGPGMVAEAALFA